MNNLTLRTLNSPYGDNTKGSVLSQADLDNNFIFLKGNIIYTAITSDDNVTLKTYNGNDITFQIGGTTGSSGTDIYVTGGSYNQSTGIATFINNTGGTFNVSGFLTGGTDVYTTGTTYNSTGGTATFRRNDGGIYSLTGLSTTQELWVSGTTGIGSIRAKSHSGADATGSYSVAHGIGNLANGVSTHAEGNGTIASGDYSHTEGVNGLANGTGSHAEGVNTIAGGDFSHAEGSGTTAIANYSHAEGSGTTASGVASHAEGVNTTASGDASYAKGSGTTAIGQNSHVEGVNGITGKALPILNVVNDTTFRLIGDNSSYFSIGQSVLTILDTFELQNTGNTITNIIPFTSYIDDTFQANSNGGFQDTVYDIKLLSDGRFIVVGSFTDYGGVSTPSIVLLNVDGTIDTSFVVGTGFNGVAYTVEENTNLTGGTVLVGGIFSDYNGTSVSNIAKLNLADGTIDTSFIQGTGFDDAVRSIVVEPTSYSIFVGGDFTDYNGTPANRIISLNSDGSVNSGFSYGTGLNGKVKTMKFNTINNTMVVGGLFTDYSGSTVSNIVNFGLTGDINPSFNQGSGFNDEVYALHIDGQDNNIFVGGIFSEYSGVTVGGLIKLNYSDGSIDSSFQTGTGFDGPIYSIDKSGQIAVGGAFTSYSGQSDVNNFVVLGTDGTIDTSFDVGTGLGSYPWKVGYTQSGHVIVGGDFMTVDAASTPHIAILNGYAYTTTTIETDFGSYTATTPVLIFTDINTSLAQHAEGFSTIASGNYSHAEGNIAIASGNYSHAEGAYTVASGLASHAEGHQSNSNGDYSHAEGYKTTASSNYSHAEGAYTVASGLASHTEGYKTMASGNFSHSEGFEAIASGNYSHSEGSGATASGVVSHAEGVNTIASGGASHAEGLGSTASGDYSHSEGNLTTASGEYSHAEGANTVASAIGSHAEGYQTIASGQFSHAEGNTTIASGDSSHAEGKRTKASGAASHAEGHDTIASGVYSHAEGNLTTASGNYSHSGGYNTTASGETSFIHGNNSAAIGDGTVVFGDNITGTTNNTVYVSKLVNKDNFTPSSSADTTGEDGSVAWDNTYFYYKANGSWLRLSGETF